MPTTGQQIIAQLKNNGVGTVFGVPGDYVLGFYNMLSKDKDIELVGTCDEAGAGSAADAYARVNGIGCLCVTYCVGGLKVINSVAGAFSEQSPVIVISGAPGIKERDEKLLLHHAVGPYNTQHELFRHITCASTVLDDPTKAGYEIDRVITAAKHYKQPVYIELPRDVVNKPIVYDAYTQGTPQSPVSDELCLKEAVEETLSWMSSAKSPVLLAGVELARHNLGAKLMKFIEATGVPVATTLLSKSVINESHPLFLGVYAGGMSKDSVRKAVEESDCLIMLGVMLTDMNMCFKPLIFDKQEKIRTLQGRVRVRNHTYDNVHFSDFVNVLCESRFKKRITRIDPIAVKPFEAKGDTKITVKRLFEKINSTLTRDMAIVADIGDSLFGASDLKVHHHNHFLGQAFYTSMGFAIPAALGILKANPAIRPIVLVGDGAFQMSSAEISTISRHGGNPIIFVLNNQGYTTERFLLDGPFNDVQNWSYHDFPSVVGDGKGYLVRTEEDLDKAVEKALASSKLSLLNILLDKMDASPALQRMTGSLSKRV